MRTAALPPARCFPPLRSTPAATLSKLEPAFSPGSGMVSPAGGGARYGLSVSAQVPAGQRLEVLGTTVDHAAKKIVVRVDGKAAPAAKAGANTQFATADLPMAQREDYLVEIRDRAGRLLQSKVLAVGGPPAP